MCVVKKTGMMIYTGELADHEGIVYCIENLFLV